MIYLLVSSTIVSSMLIWQLARVEHLVYYVSKAPQDAEAHYSDIEKLVLALVVSTR